MMENHGCHDGNLGKPNDSDTSNDNDSQSSRCIMYSDIPLCIYIYEYI